MSKQTGKRRRKLKFTPAMMVTIVVTLITAVGTILSSVIPAAFEYLETLRLRRMNEQTTQELTSSLAPTQSAVDWRELLSVHRDSQCFASYTPGYLFEGQDKLRWFEDHYLPLYEEEELTYAPRIQAEDGKNSLRLNYSITNSTKGGAWIRISKKITVSVQYTGEAPSPADVGSPSNCIVEENHRVFPSMPLNNDFPKYSDNLTANDNADYYKLEQGEFEIFEVGFECQSPGMYAVTLTIPINYQGKDSNIAYVDTPSILCPDEATYYTWEPRSSSTMVVDIIKYKWENSRYGTVEP